MAGEDKVATYTVRLDSNAKVVGVEGADALGQLKRSITASQEALVGLNAIQRNLKGSSDEVKAARAALKGQIDAERASITASTLAMLKQGVGLSDLKKKTADASKAAKELSAGIKSIGGPVAEATEAMGRMRETLAGATTGWGAVALAVTGAIAVLAAGAGAIVTGTVALVRWIFEAGNAQRTAQLLREGWTGSAESGKNLGIAVDNLARKVPLARDRLEELAGATTRALSGTMVGGQGIIDTFNAVAQASAAMGDEVGNQIGEIIKRSRTFGRVQINPFELQGTGLQFQGIAAALAKNMRVGVKEAQQALFEGRVKVDDAAKAIRDAVEARFGEVNAKRLLDFDVVAQRMREGLGRLTKDIDFSPLNKQVEALSKAFDVSTFGGKQLHDAVTAVGNAIVRMVAGGDPAEFVTNLEIAAVKAATKLVELALFIKKHWEGIKTTFTVVGIAIGALVGVVVAASVAIGAALVAIGAQIALIVAPIQTLEAIFPETMKKLEDWVKGAKDAAANFVSGLVDGIKGGITQAVGAVGQMAEAVKNRFKEVLGIHSPSAVFRTYGEQTSKGFGQGIGAGAGEAQEGAQKLAPGPPAAAGGDGAGRPALVVHVHIDASGHSQAREVTQALSSPDFLGGLTKAVEDACLGLGIPVQAAPGVP